MAQETQCLNDAVAVTKTAQVVSHVKENNIAYLIGIFVAHQMGILDKVFVYGTGLC